MKKTILITGASSGFGLLLAHQLHQKGHVVIGTSREPEKYAGKLPFKLLRLDIGDDGSIASFCEELFKLAPKLDVLVNNAGYMLTGIAEETSIELGRQQFETNFWGHGESHQRLAAAFSRAEGGADHHGQLDRRVDRAA